MRKIWIAICTLLASCLMFAGCMGGGSTSQSSDAVLSAPASIKMNSKGVLTWDAVDDATAYEVASAVKRPRLKPTSRTCLR